MTFAASERIGISRQRGFWLRCFLGAAVLAVLAGAVAKAQISILKPLRIERVQGYVTDETGKAVPRAAVKLLRDGQAVLGTATDETGWFQIDRANGQYVLSASAGVSEVGREVQVETNPLTLIGHKTLYVMIRTSGSCSDCRIQVYTSKKQFSDAVWRNTGHE
jgi:Carboxypeptidase regulatory-like domain